MQLAIVRIELTGDRVLGIACEIGVRSAVDHRVVHFSEWRESTIKDWGAIHNGRGEANTPQPILMPEVPSGSSTAS